MDIFKEVGERGEFAKFINVGDSVQGTYIDVFHGEDGFNNPQIVYVLKDKAGKLWNVGIKKTAQKTIEKMNSVRFGQIVGFRLDKIEESKNYKGKMVKYVNPFSDIRFVDKAWIDEQTKVVAALGLTLSQYQAEKMGQTIAPAQEEVHGNYDDEPPFPSNPVVAHATQATPVGAMAVPSSSTDETLAAIRTLATNKGLIPAGSIPEVADALIVGFTGLPLTAENYTTTIVKLSSFSK